MAQNLRLNPVTKRILISVAAVVGLALLIFGISAISSTKKPAETTASTNRLADETRAEVLANSALAAASKDETATARSLAKSALKLNPDNQVAVGVIKRLDEQAKATVPKGSTSPSTPTTQTSPSPTAPGTPVSPSTPDTVAPLPEDTWAKATKSLSALLPDGIADWTAGDLVAQGTDAQVTYSPDSGTEDESSVIRATFFVHDRGSVADASSFVASVDKKVYPGDGSVTQFGTQSGYFGTDGARLAVAAFSRGRYAFEVVVYSRQGIKPSTLLSLATRLATEFPASR